MNKWKNKLCSVLKDYPESEMMTLEITIHNAYFMAGDKLIPYCDGLWKIQGSWIWILALALW